MGNWSPWWGPSATIWETGGSPWITMVGPWCYHMGSLVTRITMVGPWCSHMGSWRVTMVTMVGPWCYRMGSWVTRITIVGPWLLPYGKLGHHGHHGGALVLPYGKLGHHGHHGGALPGATIWEAGDPQDERPHLLQPQPLQAGLERADHGFFSCADRASHERVCPWQRAVLGRHHEVWSSRVLPEALLLS